MNDSDFLIHYWEEDWRHENDNRIRTKEVCVCGAWRYTCLALADDGYQSWGFPGVLYIGEIHYPVENLLDLAREN